jgi:hypothetical protein
VWEKTRWMGIACYLQFFIKKLWCRHTRNNSPRGRVATRNSVCCTTIRVKLRLHLAGIFLHTLHDVRWCHKLRNGEKLPP